MKYISALLCTMLLGLLSAQAQLHELNVDKQFNWGIRVGVNAPLVDIRHLSLDGQSIDESDSESSLGLSGSLIGRYNFKKHYIQLELGMHRFYTRLTNADFGTTQVRTLSDAVDIPILYGYNITKHEPFLLNFFVGPRVSYLWNAKSKIRANGSSAHNLNYSESPNGYSFYLLGGLSTTIGHLYIDFRYAYCIRNSKDLAFQVPVEGTMRQIKISRAVNELSISIGYLW